MHTVSAHGQPTVPFTLRFGRDHGNSHLLVFTDESGAVTVLDVSKGGGTSDLANHLSARWSAHAQAIFDVDWLHGGAHLVTAAGDQTCKVWNASTLVCVQVARGHSGTVKAVAPSPYSPFIFATGARDGSIAVWDTRTSVQQQIAPVLTVQSAHFNGRNRSKRTVCSVTSVTFLPWQHLLASGGADGYGAPPPTPLLRS